MALVRYWHEDEDFKAKSMQNKANRGHGGTHNQGSKLFPVYEKDVVYIWNNLLLHFSSCSIFCAQHVFFALQVAAHGGQEIHRLTVWQMAHEKKDPVSGAVTYYNDAPKKVDKYKKAFKALHGADSDPLSEPVDEMAVMISGGGQPHGRPAILGAVHKPTITLPRIRHITSSSSMPMPSRPRRSTQSVDDVSFLSSLSSF